MSFEQLTPYDVVYYPGHSFPETHPDRLATMASYYGLESPLIERCRVLELGCGVGGNLIPIACLYPESEFIGVDLSAHAIERGQANVAALGLTNIALQNRNIMEMANDGRPFDYIIAHGVYSWVPPVVREKMLALYGECLAPNGVAYVSYNAHPGSHLRDMVRDMMLFHIRDVTEPKQRIQQARAVAKFIAESSVEETVYGAVLRDEFKRIAKMADEVLFHDDLEVNSTPFLLHQVVAAAQRHGLQYLCDATISRRNLNAYPMEAQRVLAGFPASEFMARDQYQDFIDGHGFRHTLLCHADVKLDRTFDVNRIKRFHLAAALTPVKDDLDPADAGIAEFKTEKGATLTTDHCLSKAAMLCLAQTWPGAVTFPALLDHAQARLASAGLAPADHASDEQVEALVDVLFQAVSRGIIGIHRHPPPLTAVVSERPEASLIARMQSRNGTLVTNLHHRTAMMEDEIVRQFLQLVDGTRDLDQLIADLEAGLNDGAPGGERKTVSRPNVERNLRVLAKLALLVR
jgi:SAM-dependent methyltransferase/methyltransferase-like protein